MLEQNLEEKRKSKYNINPIILKRWSPRALIPQDITDDELFALFDAARWAPSSYNGQPWRFIYAKRDTKSWDTLFNLLVDFNKSWVKNGSVLVVIISRKNFEHNEKPSITHQFDTGAAWENLALQATYQGLVVHGMEGFDYERARRDLKIPDNYDVMAMAVIGKQAAKETLPQELQEREVLSDRKPLDKIIMEGYFHDEIK